MNIKEAKDAVKKAVKIYLEKDANGEYRVPVVRQRPLFLVGAPGLGKTAIMEQVAAELDIALVSYSMTHHTRQSAIGLPYLKEVTYDGKAYTKSEYTMSEIIASVYDTIQKSGKKEGILFLDEINCVSETLAPAMLLFLQYKRFGNQSVPEGWVVVTAGNPPQFNKSVKEFDVATMDRLKMVQIDPSFTVWKEYAYNAGVHPAILAFLELNEKYFYSIRTTVNGKEYITARGWEDLSTEIQAYERNGFPVTQELISEYITDMNCVRKFAVYYDLFKKYRVDYAVADILAGKSITEAAAKASDAKYDERLSIISMLMEVIGQDAKSVVSEYHALQGVVKMLRRMKKNTEKSVYEQLVDQISALHEEMEKAKAASALSSEKKQLYLREIALLDSYRAAAEPASEKDQFKLVKAAYSKDVAKLDKMQKKEEMSMTSAFGFVESAWGNDQEMTLFVTELTLNRYVAEYISTYSNEEYYKHNAGLLVYDEKAKLDREVEQLAEMMDI